MIVFRHGQTSEGSVKGYQIREHQPFVVCILYVQIYMQGV